MKKLRVLLVDDEIMIREGFKRLFDWEAHDCQVIGDAADGMEALAKIDALRIAMFREKPSGREDDREETPIRAITRYMQEHLAEEISLSVLAEEISLSVLAEEFHLNAQYISQLFKSKIGVGFLAYPINIRMEHAKKLLLTTPLSIAEVSEQSGYGDYRVFTKTFKRSEGITPSQYRRDFLEAPGDHS